MLKSLKLLKPKRLLTFSLALFISASLFAQDNIGQSVWSYEGEEGPANWGGFCQVGLEQSPVNLQWNVPHFGSGLKFNYKKSQLKIVDTGHSIQVNFSEGSTARIRGRDYKLVQLHFHAKSEHTLSGKQYPMEMHLVHRNRAGNLAVLGLLVVEGKRNPFIDQIWSNIPKQKNREVVVQHAFIDPLGLIPTEASYYHYEGSLTEPPCTEGVNWNILNTPVEMSKAQIKKFRSYYSNNYRPLQKLNGRKLINF